MYQDYLDKVREQAISIPEGCSDRGTCPKCGSTSAFAMSRTGSEISFICFSASCNYKGRLSSRGQAIGTKDTVTTRHKKLFNGSLSALADKEIEWLADKFKIRRMYLRHVRYNEQDGRVYYPQYDMSGRVMGYIARYYPEIAYGKKVRGAKAIWKAVLNKDMSLCFPFMDVLTQAVERKEVAVVEDYPSALRMNSQLHYPTLCLGGTNIYESHINTMLAMGINKLVIVLDADAITKAIKLKRSLGLAFDEVLVIPLLGADPKDMDTSELDKTFKQLRNY
jgi:hypothetical protein